MQRCFWSWARKIIAVILSLFFILCSLKYRWSFLDQGIYALNLCLYYIAAAASLLLRIKDVHRRLCLQYLRMLVLQRLIYANRTLMVLPRRAILGETASQISDVLAGEWSQLANLLELGIIRFVVVFSWQKEAWSGGVTWSIMAFFI